MRFAIAAENELDANLRFVDGPYETIHEVNNLFAVVMSNIERQFDLNTRINRAANLRRADGTAQVLHARLLRWRRANEQIEGLLTRAPHNEIQRHLPLLADAIAFYIANKHSFAGDVGEMDDALQRGEH